QSYKETTESSARNRDLLQEVKPATGRTEAWVLTSTPNCVARRVGCRVSHSRRDELGGLPVVPWYMSVWCPELHLLGMTTDRSRS
ncbi:hypothetical protein RRG08_064243, partial [Elysia crispata]